MAVERCWDFTDLPNNSGVCASHHNSREWAMIICASCIQLITRKLTDCLSVSKPRASESGAEPSSRFAGARPIGLALQALISLYYHIVLLLLFGPRERVQSHQQHSFLTISGSPQPFPLSTVYIYHFRPSASPVSQTSPAGYLRLNFVG